MLSYWEKQYWLEDSHFLVIGAGIVGLSTGIYLKKNFPKAIVTVIEKGKLPYGASTRNAGFTCFATVGEILDDLTYSNEEEVIKTIELRWLGLKKLMQLIDSKHIQYNNCGGFEVFKNKYEFQYCADNVDHINQILQEVTHIGKTILVSGLNYKTKFYRQTLFNKFEGQLNPVLLIQTLLKKAQALGVLINFGFEAKELTKYSDGWKVELDNHFTINAKNVVIATNAFTKSLISEDIIPARNQVLISKPIPSLSTKGTFHYDKGYVYFRNVEDRLLIGGARNLDSQVELTMERGANNKIIEHLKSFAEKYIIETPFEIDTKWSGIIATGKSKRPIVRKEKEGIYLAVRMGGMGVAIGAEVASQVVELIKKDVSY